MFIVPRTWILGLASGLWVVPSVLLLRYAIVWTNPLELNVLALSTTFGLGMIGLGYWVWFRRIVAGNIKRIRALPSRANIWHVSSPGGYMMVLLMITMGMVLRSSDLPRVYLAGPYAMMGGCLLLGAIQMGIMFIKEIVPLEGSS